MSGFVPQSILVTHGGTSSSAPSPNTCTPQPPPLLAIERRSTVPRKDARQVNPSTPPPPSCQLDSERSASVASNEPQRADNVAESPQRRSDVDIRDTAAHRACDGGEDAENDVFSCETQSAEVRAASLRRCTSSRAPLPAATRAGSKRASWNASVSRSATLAGSADQPPSSHPVPKEAGEHPDRSCVLSLQRQSFVGPLLAVLERSVRQLLHRKLDFVFEMAMSLVFVAIAVLLWGIGGSVNIRQEQMYGVADVQVPGESECSLASPFIVMPYLHDPCYIVPDPARESTFFTQHACTFHNTRLSLAAAQALDYECVSNLSQIPVESLSICRQADISWDVALNIYLLRYLLDLLKLPSIDGIIEMQWFALGSGSYARQQALPSAQGLVSNSRFNAVLCSGNLYFVGDVSSTTALITYLGKTSSLLRYVNNGKVHASVAAARAAANGRSVWSIVELRRMDAGGLDLVLHMNNSALPSFRTTYDTAYPGGVAYDTFELYILSGYLTLQQAVSEYYLNTFHAIPTSELIFTHHTPTVPYTRLPTLLNAMETFPFIFSFVFIYSVSQQAKRIVQERELRLREAMLIMGLPQWTLYVGELVMQVAVFVVTCALATVLLRLTFVTKSDPLLVFLVFFLFALTTIPLSGLIAAFVSHAEHAALVAPVVYMVSIAPMVATSNVRGSLVTGFSVLSPSGFAAAMKLLLQHEASTGCGVAELRSSEDNPTLAVILAMLVGDFFIYYVLMLYVDAVVPKEWGTPKHPLFFVVEPARWLLGRARCVPAGGPDGRAADGVFETTDYADDVVRFAGLRKEYARGGKAFVAVDNLYWGMREGEISVLVGHNGAGKTTVLNMVTGMVAADGGDCVVYGASVWTSRDAVRQDLGYCPQHNILWSELTCRDHLEFYAKVKGLRGWALEDAVCRLLYEADLLEKADVAAARLSGGQKRRLSVAIAFVGGGRLVLLDEPTAGLDVGARRQVWELLKRMSRTRVVLLTTHYMDEADLLASRIAMLSQGRLKLSGSSAFLKLRLGVGYRLVVDIGRGEDSKNVDRVVFGGVRGAVKESRSATELSYRLPDRSVEDFAAVLRAVERGDADGVRGYALTATTLEDVYVRASEADAVDDRVAAAEEDIELIWSCEVYHSVAWSQFKAMLAKRLWCALRDRRMQCLQVVCPIACILIAMILGLVNFSAPRTLEMDFGMFGREQRSQLLSLNCEHLWGTAPTAPNVDVTAVDRSLNVGDASQLKMYLADTWYVHPAPRFGAIACWNRDIDGRNNQTIFNATLCPSTPFRSSILLLQNTSSRHQAPVNLGLYYSLRLQEKGGEGGPTVRYTTQLLEKPATYTQLSYIYAVAIIAAPFMLLPSAAAAWIVKERELGARSLQDMCGLSVPVYWAANFAFDVLSYILVALLFVTIFAIFQRTDLVGADRVGGTLLLFVVSGCTSTVYMYCWSFLFKEHGTAQAVTAIVNFFLGFAMILIVYVLTMNADYAHIPPKLRYGFRVVPSYCILEGLLGLLTLTVNVRVGAARSVWDMDQLGWPLVYMAAEFPLLWAVVLLADHPRVQRAVGLCGYRRNAPPEVGCDEDSDVEEERRAVYEAQNNPTRADVLRMVDLRKTYGDGTAAVRGVTLSVFASEVFGLLGTNGAGKTTTLSMLCQRVVPSGGSAYVCGYDVVADSAEALACIGCCPQADATLDLLTVEEQLRLYAGIRGIPGEYWDRVVAALCTLCMLTAYRTTVTCALSGGNRRKLSVALSMIGGPRVLFLDEPTAGMDPVTRRGVWAAIRRAAGYCSVVLTTHHLEEVERVADAVAIMVRGSVQCIGDAAYLKEKFSRVAEVELVVGAGCDCARAEGFVAARMAGAVRVGGDGRRLVYHVPCEGGVGELFALLQAHQAALHVVDYRVSATSIEETFVRVKTKAELRGRGPALHSSEIVAGKARVY